MVFYKKTGTLLSPLAVCWCICCFQLAWWHPFSESRCCPLLHWCNSGITPLTSVKWLQIYPWWKQNWTTIFLVAYPLWCSQKGAPLPYHKGKVSACLLCHGQLFCVLDIALTCLAGAEFRSAVGYTWSPDCPCWMEQLLPLDSWPLSYSSFHQLPHAWIYFPRSENFLS